MVAQIERVSIQPLNLPPTQLAQVDSKAFSGNESATGIAPSPDIGTSPSTIKIEKRMFEKAITASAGGNTVTIPVNSSGLGINIDTKA